MDNIIPATSLRVRPPQPPPPPEPVEVETPELDKATAHFAKHYGEDIIRPASMLPIHRHIQTGAFTLDLALLGGIPENTYFMVYGAESSSKTTLMMKLAGAFQRKYPHKKVVWVDPEITFDKIWAAKQGVDVNALRLSQPGSGELAVDIVATMMGVEEVSFVVLDSIGALCPMNVLEKSAEDKTYAEVARLCSNLCQRLNGVMNNERMREHYPTFGAVNQFRDKQNVTAWGNPNKLPGGRQINYNATTKIWMKGKRVLGKNEYGDEVPDHIEQSFTLEKAKVGSSIVQGEFIMHMNPSGVGAHTNGLNLPQGVFVDAKTVAAQAKKMGIIHGGGQAWYIENVDGRRFGRLAEIEEFLYTNEASYLRLRQLIIAEYRRKAGLPTLPPDQYLLDWVPAGVAL